jgi:3-oxoacyl-[acyl-carrier-protein] synthase III
VSGRFSAAGKVAIAGYAHSLVERHADRPLGALAVDTACQAIADAGIGIGAIDGVVTAALFPTAGAHVAEDGVAIVTANWMAEHRARWRSR